jgi:hypothetical protein
MCLSTVLQNTRIQQLEPSDGAQEIYEILFSSLWKMNLEN